MAGWITHGTSAGGRFATHSSLSGAGLIHAFTLRPRTDQAALEPPEALREAGLVAPGVASPRQVHGSVVARLAEHGIATVPQEADAVLVDRPGAAAVRTADCVGGLLFAPGAAAFVALHAGWRGILAGVVEASVASLRNATGRPAAGMILVTGPAVSRCCYEVGEDVERPFRALFDREADGSAVFGSRNGRCTIDPPAAVGILAGRAGLLAERIHRSDLCTMCRPDLCWSWRAHGTRAGRMWTVAGLREG